LARCTEQTFPKEKEEGLNDEDVRLSPDVWRADAGTVKNRFRTLKSPWRFFDDNAMEDLWITITWAKS
jgi:hypothetical protein